MRYFRPKSLTWWGSIFSIGLGVTTMTCQHCDLGEISRLISMLMGGADASPAGMIMLGIVGVGLNDKFERQYND